MGDVGACWDNAVVERFFGSLKHDWLFKIAQPTRSHMRKDVAAYMKYYNSERPHTSNDDMSPDNTSEFFIKPLKLIEECVPLFGTDSSSNLSGIQAKRVSAFYKINVSGFA